MNSHTFLRRCGGTDCISMPVAGKRLCPAIQQEGKNSWTHSSLRSCCYTWVQCLVQFCVDACSRHFADKMQKLLVAKSIHIYTLPFWQGTSSMKTLGQSPFFPYTNFLHHVLQPFLCKQLLLGRPQPTPQSGLKVACYNADNAKQSNQHKFDLRLQV